MATQLVTRPDGGAPGPELLRLWRAAHLFYHADRDVMLRELVWPLVRELTTERLTDRFYFVRYSFGGPHLRLRWRLRHESEAEHAEDILSRRAVEFFAKFPSQTALGRDKVLATNQALATADAAAANAVDHVSEDNSWTTAPTLFEIDRYGGPEHINSSLDLFCFSSAAVLKTFREHGGDRRGWGNSAALPLLLQLAWSLARDEQDVVRLSAYASEAWGQPLEPCMRQADMVFAGKEKQITEMVIAGLESLNAMEKTDPPAGLAAVARRLAAEISGQTQRMRWQITSSHLHMTANRMGLTNPEEVYLSRLLWRGIEQLRQQYPGTWRFLWLSRMAGRFPSQDQSITQALEIAMQSPLQLQVSA